MIRLMLDIETFSRQPNAAVFEVAIVPFDENGKEPAAPVGYWLWTPRTGHFDGETVVWWMARGGRADLNPEMGPDELDVAHIIHAYLSGFPEDTELWAQHTSFDCVILQQLLERHDYPMPLGFRQWMDLPTLRAAASNPKVLRTGPRHSAMNDCRHQIDVFCKCWEILGLRAAARGVGPVGQRYTDAAELLARGVLGAGWKGIPPEKAFVEANALLVGDGTSGPRTPLILTDAQVAYLEEKRGSDVWTAADFNRALRSVRG